MSMLNILLLSDIHFKNTNPENEGKVLSAFFKDLNETMDINERDFNYCIISGDLVQAGSSDVTYSNFYDVVVKKILPFVPLDHFMITPGNHDLSQDTVKYNFEDHQKEISGQYDESAFNEAVNDGKLLMVRKFKAFENFSKNNMLIEDFGLAGYSRTISPQLSFFFLNTAFCSCGGYNHIEDQGHLKVETSALNDWILKNDGKKKVLVMHHPIEHLVDDCQHEILSLLRSKIDIVLSGHTHYEIAENIDNGDGVKYLKMTSPQLFSSKGDLNGYSVMRFDERQLEEIQFRQYSGRFNKFLPGLDFSGEGSGVQRFDKINITIEDFVYKKLKNDFESGMESYDHIPVWAERTLTNIPLINSNRGEEEIYDYVRILNYVQDYQIVAPEEFGSTCLAKYLALKAWEEKHDLWLYFDTPEIKRKGLSKAIETHANTYMLKADDVKCVIFDNWNRENPIYIEHLQQLRKEYPQVKAIIISNVDGLTALKGMATDESFEGFMTLYLRELNTASMRVIVRGLNDELQIGEENLVLKRLCEDITDLNMHRTPINCLQLLLSLKNNLKKRPVNRVMLMDELIKVIFSNRDAIYYKISLDERSCKFLLGYLCELLLRSKQKDMSYDLSFNEEFFITHIVDFAKKEHDSSNVKALLEILKKNQIVVADNNGRLKFRFLYWIFFFAAWRMKTSADFWQFMVKDFQALYRPVVMEFYSGIDGERKDIVPLLIDELRNVANLVHNKIGIADDYNPYDDFKWIIQENKKIETLDEVSERVQRSNLPDNLKDAAADKTYNQIRPYNQEISQVLDKFFVRRLFDLVQSAARTLRNGEFIGGELKEQLLQEIQHGWKEIQHVLLLLSPVLAKTGYGGIGGKNFQLDDTFPEEFNACWVKIIQMLPYNIVEWFRIDMVSDRLLPILSNSLDTQKDELLRHMTALMICAGQMDGCESVIKKYISSVHKNSFYLYDLYCSMQHYYRYRYLDSSDRHSLEELIKVGYAKHYYGSKDPGKQLIAKVEVDFSKGRKK